MNVDRRPIFTIGQVWFDFVKRLPRSHPRYHSPLTDAQRAQALGMQQASAEMLASMQYQQAIQMQFARPFQQQPWLDRSNPFGFPWP
jgi:hypothetical protein